MNLIPAPISSPSSPATLAIASRSARHNRATPIAHADRRDNQSEPTSSVSTPDAARIALIATAASLAALSSGQQAAHAIETWQPRRHHRRIADEVLERGMRADARARAIRARSEHQNSHAFAAQGRPSSASKTLTAADALADPSAAFREVQRSTQRAYRKAKRALFGDTPVYSVGTSGRPDARYYYGTADASPLGWAVGILAVGAAIYAVFGKKWFSSAKRPHGGRWIRDRSLGGKMVFIPDASSSAEQHAARPLWADDDTFSSELAATAASRGAGTMASSEEEAALKTASVDGRKIADVEPEWWAPPAHAKYVTETRKEELKRQAKMTLRQLEDAKLLRGEDYSLSGLVSLRNTCHEGGGLTVRPSTESGRDAIFRSGVKLSLETPGTLGKWEPARFISGLARDLGIPDKRAITMVHAVVAATCRSALIDAEAGFRAGEQADVLRSLSRMVSALAAFPLPESSPEAEVVGRAIQSQTSLEFRRAVFLAAGSANLATAPVVARMLGFDPELVMPNLWAQMAAAAAQHPSGGTSGEEGEEQREDTVNG